MCESDITKHNEQLSYDIESHKLGKFLFIACTSIMVCCIITYYMVD